MFRVEWIEKALDELAAAWTDSSSETRTLINSAVAALDQQLKTNPFHRSESRQDELRVMFEYPLGILFEVELSQRVASVLHAWRFRRRGETH